MRALFIALGLFALSVLAIVTLAQAPPAATPAPALTDAQKVELLKAERKVQDDELQRANISQEFQRLTQQSQADQTAMRALADKYSKDVCGEAGQLNSDTLECMKAPPASTDPAKKDSKPMPVPAKKP